MIFALVAPAIAGLGRGAGKWLGITAGIAYGSTIISGLTAYGLSIALYPTLLAGQSINTNVSDIEEGALAPTSPSRCRRHLRSCRRCCFPSALA